MVGFCRWDLRTLHRKLGSWKPCFKKQGWKRLVDSNHRLLACFIAKCVALLRALVAPSRRLLSVTSGLPTRKFSLKQNIDSRIFVPVLKVPTRWLMTNDYQPRGINVGVIFIRLLSILPLLWQLFAYIKEVIPGDVRLVVLVKVLAEAIARKDDRGLKCHI